MRKTPGGGKINKILMELRYLQVLKNILKDHVEGESQLHMGSANKLIIWKSSCAD